MVNTQFKALTYLGNFVDVGELIAGRGIYLKDVPELYSLGETKESLSERWNEWVEIVAREFGGSPINFQKDLDQCELKTIEIKIL